MCLPDLDFEENHDFWHLSSNPAWKKQMSQCILAMICSIGFVACKQASAETSKGRLGALWMACMSDTKS
jgi:hypothetical protein